MPLLDPAPAPDADHSTGSARLAVALTRASLRRPVATVALLGAAIAWLAHGAATVPSEVGYAAYFGPRSPELERLEAYLEEFESGVHLIVVFGCRETPRCRSIGEPFALDLLARLHVALDRLPNVRRTWSALDVPIVVGPLETRTLATREGDRFALAADWAPLLAAARTQRAFRSAVLAADGRSAGVVVELRSLASGPLRETVHGVQALLPAFAAELGAEIHLAGDPVWTVASADTLDRDSRVLTALMFLVMGALLFALYRDPWLALLPVLAVAAVTATVQGIAAAAGVPSTSLLGALPPLLVVLAIAASIHLLSAIGRAPAGDARALLVRAASEVGPGCFWSAVTTMAGFASFLWSDLESFRDFGTLAAVGVAVAYGTTFTLLPALLHGPLARRRSAARQPIALPDEMLGALRRTVSNYPRFVVAACLASFGLLATGASRLHYAHDFGFGEQSWVVRSLRAIEANARKPMTTDVAITLPPGVAAYDRAGIALQAEVEAVLAREPTTGAVNGFLALLGDAFLLDAGRAPASLDDVVEAAPRLAALAAASDGARRVWRESLGDGRGERVRISADRAWLDDAAQTPYVERITRALAAIEARAPAGTELQLEGGLVLADRFVSQLRDTQWQSFLSAFALVAATLAALLRGHGVLVPWAIVANALPVLALVGLMGWSGIGVDPANTMVGAILIGVGVDDTIHVSLRYARARRSGADVASALDAALRAAGVPVIVASGVLALGFSVLLFAEWGGLVGFGLLASLGIALLLAGDLLLLPAALLVTAQARSA